MTKITLVKDARDKEMLRLTDMLGNAQSLMCVGLRHPELFNGPVFTWLANISDEASLSKEERIRYDAALRAYRDTIAVMDGQYSEGMEKGREEGRE